MFRRGLLCCVIFAIIGMTMAVDYTLFTRTVANANGKQPNKVELTTTAVTNPFPGHSILLTWTFNQAPVPADTNKMLTVCCVESLLSSTDPLAAHLKDKCFGVSLFANGAAMVAAGTGKVIIAQGTKNGSNFHPNAYINPLGTAGDEMGAAVTATFKATSAAYSLSDGQLAAIGVLPSAATTINYSCGTTDFATAGAANTITANTAIAIPATGTTTFSITGTGTSACKTTTTTSTSSATLEGMIQMAFLTPTVALLTLS